MPLRDMCDALFRLPCRAGPRLELDERAFESELASRAEAGIEERRSCRSEGEAEPYAWWCLADVGVAMVTLFGVGGQ